MRKNSNIEQKYFNFMKDLHAKIEKGEKFSAVQFCKKRKVGSSIFTALTKLGYIKSDRRGHHTWTGPKPSLEVVEQVRTYHSEISSYYNNIRRSKKAIEAKTKEFPKFKTLETAVDEEKSKDIEVVGATEIKVVNPRVIYTKVFFGLFTLKSTIEY